MLSNIAFIPYIKVSSMEQYALRSFNRYTARVDIVINMST